jgi:hypothetical protein
MKTVPSESKTGKSGKSNRPFEVVKEGSFSVPIYVHTNIIPQRDPQTGAIIYEYSPVGERKALIKYQSDIYTVAYYLGAKRFRRKFSDLAEAKREAGLIALKLANGEGEVLKLTGGDRADYVRAMQKLRAWKPDVDLNLVVTDYVAAVRRLPENVSLGDAIQAYLKRHPAGLPQKTVKEVVDELIASKAGAGKSDVYIKDLTSRLGAFAGKFNVRITNVTGKEIEEYIRGLKTHNIDESQRRQIAGRTQNNIRRLISTLFKFAIKRGYLPKDHDELGGVDIATVDSGEIEVFTPDELRKLFAACTATVMHPVAVTGWRSRLEIFRAVH